MGEILVCVGAENIPAWTGTALPWDPPSGPLSPPSPVRHVLGGVLRVAGGGQDEGSARRAPAPVGGPHLEPGAEGMAEPGAAGTGQRGRPGAARLWPGEAVPQRDPHGGGSEKMAAAAPPPQSPPRGRVPSASPQRPAPLPLPAPGAAPPAAGWERRERPRLRERRGGPGGAGR